MKNHTVRIDKNQLDRLGEMYPNKSEGIRRSLQLLEHLDKAAAAELIEMGKDNVDFCFMRIGAFAKIGFTKNIAEILAAAFRGEESVFYRVMQPSRPLFPVKLELIYRYQAGGLFETISPYKYLLNLLKNEL